MSSSGGQSEMRSSSNAPPGESVGAGTGASVGGDVAGLGASEGEARVGDSEIGADPIVGLVVAGRLGGGEGEISGLAVTGAVGTGSAVGWIEGTPLGRGVAIGGKMPPTSSEVDRSP